MLGSRRKDRFSEPLSHRPEVVGYTREVGAVFAFCTLAVIYQN